MIGTCITPLFVPADRPERFAKAAASGADALVIDLEDAVAQDAKAAARAALAAFDIAALRVPVMVRVNGSATGHHEADVACIAALPLVGAMLAKTGAAADVARLAERLGGRDVVALIETAGGLVAAREIARTMHVSRLAFGSIDFAADVGCAHDRNALLTARSELVLASALAGLAGPLDGVTTSLDDAVAVEADARHAASLGFGGKLCIHPRQVLAAARGFVPAADEIDWARRVLMTEGDGAARVDGMMVDAPVRARARRIVARADRLG